MARAKKTDFIPGPIHPDLPFDDDSVAEPALKTAATDQAAQLAELTANFKRLEEANANLQRTNLALMGQGLAQPQMPNFGPQEVNLENLPDPVINPKEYAAEIVKRGDQVIQARQQANNWQSQQQQSLQQRVDGIWEQFGQAYPGYAINTDLVEAAASKAVERAKAQGIDPSKYMFAATPTFFADTVKILGDWGIKGDGDETPEPEDNTPAQRTAGIPGGLESGGRVAGKAQEPSAMPTLADEVKDWKLKSGWY